MTTDFILVGRNGYFKSYHDTYQGTTWSEVEDPVKATGFATRQEAEHTLNGLQSPSGRGWIYRPYEELQNAYIMTREVNVIIF